MQDDGKVIIRKYLPRDEAALQEITYRTGFQGEDLSGHVFFDDERLFFLIFIYYYPRYEPENCFVAEERGNGKVIGFICGTPDTSAQERRFARLVAPKILIRALGYTSWRRPRTFVNLLGMARSRGVFDRARMKEIQDEYPAHLHINLSPGSQRQGIGSRLLERFEDNLIALGVDGLHLSTSNYHHKALPFYEKNGYTLLDESGVLPHPLRKNLRVLTYGKKLA